MSVTSVLSNHFKYQLMDKKLDIDSDSIKVLLMRENFIFDKDKHAKKINIKTNSGVIGTLTFSDAANTLTRGAGNFVTDGFVVGNLITTNSTNGNNQGPFLISVLAETVLTVTNTSGGDPTLSSGVENNVTVTSEDELNDGNGYHKDTMVLAGQTMTESDSDDMAQMTCDDIVWTADGGAIGPTPGAILYDDTSSDDTIIGYIDFGTDQTVQDKATLNISGVGIRLT